MDVPLRVNRVIGKDGEQLLSVWTNAAEKVVRAPFLPYCYAEALINLDRDAHPEFGGCRIQQVDVNLLSAPKETVSLVKYEFRNVKGVSAINRMINDKEVSCKVYENHILFPQRVLMDLPDYYRQFANTEPLKVMAIDFEMDSVPGVFPKPDKYNIIAGGYTVNGKDVHIRMTKDNSDEESRAVVKWIVLAIVDENPDLIVGYNLKNFDLYPWLADKCKQFNVNLNIIGRGDWPVRIKEGYIDIPGRVVWDLLEPVSLERSQRIIDTGNARMKVVAEFLKFDNVIVEEADNMRELIGTDRLREYLESDVRITWKLYERYIDRYITTAEDVGMPLEMLINGAVTLVCKLTEAQDLKKLDIISDGCNRDRIPEIFTTKKYFQAAKVKLYKRGLYKNVKKVDFRSFYPKLMQLFNLSPETTKIEEIRPYTGKYSFKVTDDYFLFNIPDVTDKVEGGKIVGVKQRDIVIRVDRTVKGFLVDEIERLFGLRAEVKKKMKGLDKDSAEWRLLKGMDWGYKVPRLNMMFGYNGNAYADYGDGAVAIAIVGTGREDFISYIENLVEELGASLLEVDTDGIYLDGDIDIDDINARLDKYVHDKYGIECKLELELDEYKAGYFHEEKQYILLDDQDRLIVHGVSFKSSEKPGLLDDVLDVIGRALLEGDDDKLRQECILAYSLEAYDFPKDFIMSRTVHKCLDSLGDGSLGAQLMRDGLKAGIDAVPNTTYYYLKTKLGYRLPYGFLVTDLDSKYYSNRITDLLVKLGLERFARAKFKLKKPKFAASGKNTSLDIF